MDASRPSVETGDAARSLQGSAPQTQREQR
jgi:hypothetical protein